MSILFDRALKILNEAETSEYPKPKIEDERAKEVLVNMEEVISSKGEKEIPADVISKFRNDIAKLPNIEDKEELKNYFIHCFRDEVVTNPWSHYEISETVTDGSTVTDTVTEAEVPVVPPVSGDAPPEEEKVKTLYNIEALHVPSHKRQIINRYPMYQDEANKVISSLKSAMTVRDAKLVPFEKPEVTKKESTVKEDIKKPVQPELKEDADEINEALGKLYVGKIDTNKWEQFYSEETPTKDSHGAKYKVVIGPFHTHTGAKYFLANPTTSLTTVSEIEKEAKKEQAPAVEESIDNEPSTIVGKINIAGKDNLIKYIDDTQFKLSVDGTEGKKWSNPYHIGNFKDGEAMKAVAEWLKAPSKKMIGSFEDLNEAEKKETKAVQQFEDFCSEIVKNYPFDIKEFVENDLKLDFNEVATKGNDFDLVYEWEVPLDFFKKAFINDMTAEKGDVDMIIKEIDAAGIWDKSYEAIEHLAKETFDGVVEKHKDKELGEKKVELFDVAAVAKDGKFKLRIDATFN